MLMSLSSFPRWLYIINTVGGHHLLIILLTLGFIHPSLTKFHILGNLKYYIILILTHIILLTNEVTSHLYSFFLCWTSSGFPLFNSIIIHVFYLLLFSFMITSYPLIFKDYFLFQGHESLPYFLLECLIIYFSFEVIIHPVLIFKYSVR